MRDTYFHVGSIAMTLVGLAFTVFLYSTEPRTIAEVTTKGQVALGTYKVDAAEFDRGIAAFRRDEFAAARASFDRADPEKRDAITQFYTAYSFYRQGWGRVTNDDALFKEGLAAVGRVLAIEPTFRIADETLGLKTAVDLKAELEEGMKVTAEDFNPLKLTRERK